MKPAKFAVDSHFSWCSVLGCVQQGLKTGRFWLVSVVGPRYSLRAFERLLPSLTMNAIVAVHDTGLHVGVSQKACFYGLLWCVQIKQSQWGDIYIYISHQDIVFQCFVQAYLHAVAFGDPLHEKRWKATDIRCWSNFTTTQLWEHFFLGLGLRLWCTQRGQLTLGRRRSFGKMYATKWCGTGCNLGFLNFWQQYRDSN